eukprot:TRINITY_DN1447_c0_g1_i1.p2 TRINITY_DN1447_c0_g1~~TRINITY_DN1447_c0_g1_i1.p2  ORF type:complete len:419 (-),score=51.13 TRINITY_DN1447_c0_g1_i1:16-1272(-)
MLDSAELKLADRSRHLVMEWVLRASNLHWRSLTVAYTMCRQRPKHTARNLLAELTEGCRGAAMMPGIPLEGAPFPMILTAAAILSHPLSIWENIDGIVIHKYIMVGLLHNALEIAALRGRPDQWIVPQFSLIPLLGHIKDFIATHPSGAAMTKELLLARALVIFLEAQELVLTGEEVAWSVFETVVARWMHVTFAASSVLADLSGAPSKRPLFSQTPDAKPLLNGLVVVQGQSPVVDNSGTRLLKMKTTGCVADLWMELTTNDDETVTELKAGDVIEVGLNQPGFDLLFVFGVDGKLGLAGWETKFSAVGSSTKLGAPTVKGKAQKLGRYRGLLWDIPPDYLGTNPIAKLRAKEKDVVFAVVGFRDATGNLESELTGLSNSGEAIGGFKGVVAVAGRAGAQSMFGSTFQRLGLASVRK